MANVNNCSRKKGRKHYSTHDSDAQIQTWWKSHRHSSYNPYRDMTYENQFQSQFTEEAE